MTASPASRPVTVSVVTATRNRAATLGDAIASVQGQSHRPLEHVIQDGASDDGSPALVGRMSDPTTRFVSEPDRGLYDALNRGIARATGEVIGVMHSDDVFADAHVLARVADAMSDPGLDGVYGDLDYVSAADPSRVIRRWRSGPYDPAALGRGWMPPHPTLFLRRAVFERHGAYDTTLRIAADYEAMLRWLTAGVRLVHLPQVMVKMRMGGASNGSLRRMLRKSREDLAAMRRHRVGGFGTLAWKNLSKLPQFRPGAGR